VEGKNHHLVEEGTGCYCRVEDTEEAHTVAVEEGMENVD